MSADVLDQVRDSLLEKRENVANWLFTTPPPGKQVQLGPAGEEAVRAHLDVLDTTVDKVADGTFGICKVCHGHVETELLEMDYTADVCLGDLSPDEARSLESELALAQSVQRSLMPQQVPQTPGLEIAAFSRPAQIVGGDYFDFFEFQGGAQGLAIADVAGHGISASLYMASVQTLLRTLVTASDSPAEVARRMHHLLVHNVRFATFVTLFLGAYNATTRTLAYCNAGHNPPLLMRPGANGGADALTWLWPTGAAIGLVEEFTFKGATVDLRSGDLLVLYTDGVTEVLGSDGQPFGRAKLAQVVQRVADSSARALVRAIRQELERFTGGQPAADDTTFIVCKVTA
jgi:sigma-B regulation protein RsbU (phosphoserine phosphatase)